jgi:hypothetical protein
VELSPPVLASSAGRLAECHLSHSMRRTRAWLLNLSSLPERGQEQLLAFLKRLTSTGNVR